VVATTFFYSLNENALREVIIMIRLERVDIKEEIIVEVLLNSKVIDIIT